MDYKEAVGAKQFLILRHDIEFSVEHAYQISLIENEEKIRSTYFVQIASNAYNAFSQKNLVMLENMIQNGHRIGLHYHLGKNISKHYITDEIKSQIQILSKFLDYPVDRFSIHRPTEKSQYYDIQMEGIINAYSKDFFTHIENVEMSSKLEVKYIADSKHQWNYGYPDTDTLKKFPKIQLLIHPYSWNEKSCDTVEAFCALADEKEKETLDNFDEETKIFHAVRKEVEKKRECNKNGISKY